MAGGVVVEVEGLWRYPVKSLQGEAMTTVSVVEDGILGDRQWGILDVGTGRILTARRRPELLDASASLHDGEPTITLPDGEELTGSGVKTDRSLSEWLHSPVTLVPSRGRAGRAEYFADATDDTSPPVEWTMPEGRFVDAAPVLVVTTSSLRTGASLYPSGVWAARRFRPNLLLATDDDGWAEDGWAARLLQIGSAVLLPTQPCIRCTMVTRQQPGLEPDADIFRTLARHHHGHLGMWSTVVTSGTATIGDRASLASTDLARA